MNGIAIAAVVVATLLVTNLIAFLRRGEPSFRIFTSDPNHHSGIAITASMVGTIVGGGMFLAVGQIGYEAGVTGLVFGVATLIGLIVISIFVPKIRKLMTESNADTLVQLIENVFSKRLAVLFSLVSGVMYLFLLAGQFVALYCFGDFASVQSGKPALIWSLVALSGVSALVYPIVGGLRKDISTDLFQGALILMATALIIYAMASGNTVSTDWSSLTTDHLSGVGYGPTFLAGVLLFLPTLFLVRMDVWQRVRACRSDTGASRAFLVAGVASLFFYAFFTALGMWSFAGGVMEPAHATLGILIQAMKNEVMLGVVIGAFLAAVLSSADTFINNTSIFFARVVAPRAWRRNAAGADEGKWNVLLVTRVLAIVLTLGAAVLGWIAGDFVDLLVGAFSLVLIFLPAILGIFVSSWRTESAAFYGAASGLVLFAPAFFFWNPKLAFAPSVVVSILVFVILQRIRTTGARKATG